MDQIKSFRVLRRYYYFFFSDRADVAGNLFWTEKTVLAKSADRNNIQMASYSDLGNIFGPFFFEISKENASF